MNPSSISIKRITEYSPSIEEAITRLLPQLDAEKPLPDTAAIKEILDSTTTFFLIAEDVTTGVIVGMLTLAIYRIPVGKQAWIEDVVVDSAYRGHGIGKRLVEEAIQRAKDERVSVVRLTSNSTRQAANALYHRLGFQIRETNVFRLLL